MRLIKVIFSFDLFIILFTLFSMGYSPRFVYAALCDNCRYGRTDFSWSDPGFCNGTCNGGDMGIPCEQGGTYHYYQRYSTQGGHCVLETWEGAFCTGCGGGGCFVEGTEIETKSQSDKVTEGQSDKEIKEIEKLEAGDVVSSFNPETGEISESQVSEVHKITREGYYELETESGKKVKVTGEHPFLAVKSEENLIFKLKNVLSNTLTFRLITGLQAKLVEILD